MLLAPASSEPIPATACLDDLADSGVQLQHDTDVFGAPGVGLRARAGVHGDVGVVEASQRGVHGPYRRDVGTAGLLERGDGWAVHAA